MNDATTDASPSDPAPRAAIVRNGTVIDATFAEAFGMRGTRILVTAHDDVWAMHAGVAATGFATSVIGCGVEAGIERRLKPSETPDGRPGVALLFFTMSGKDMIRQIERRIGQCVMTCPTTAVFNGLADSGNTEDVALGSRLRYFGDGFQISKKIGDTRYWRVPVMDGEFLVQDKARLTRDAVGGGNLLILADDLTGGLRAAAAAVAAMRQLPNVVMPFPGGVVRSGSKVGSKYPALGASTNDAYCPTLRGATASELDPRTGAVLEIVIDGLTQADVAAAMRVGLATLCAIGAAGGVHRISAGNYGGKLGPFHFNLHDLAPAA